MFKGRFFYDSGLLLALTRFNHALSIQGRYIARVEELNRMSLKGADFSTEEIWEESTMSPDPISLDLVAFLMRLVQTARNLFSDAGFRGFGRIRKVVNILSDVA